MDDDQLARLGGLERCSPAAGGDDRDPAPGWCLEHESWGSDELLEGRCWAAREQLAWARRIVAATCEGIAGAILTHGLESGQAAGLVHVHEDSWPTTCGVAAGIARAWGRV